VATFRNCSILSIYHLMTFFVILNKKCHVARKKSYCFDFALNRRGMKLDGRATKSHCSNTQTHF
ncbi:hypothetical protein ELK16_32505, partial [Klebsiella pneumoniae]|nr:hypothetical protein [Klebsiella pneumoniae]